MSPYGVIAPSRSGCNTSASLIGRSGSSTSIMGFEDEVEQSLDTAPTALEFLETGRYIDGDAIGQRHHRADTGDRHQPPPHLTVSATAQPSEPPYGPPPLQ